MSQKQFGEDMAERKKIGELKKDDRYSYVLFIVHTSIIEKGWTNAEFVQGLRNNTWVAIPGFVQNGPTQNVGSQKEVSQKPPD